MGLGRTLILLGLIIAAVGVVVIVLGKFVPLGRLPGDITFRRENLTFYFPVVTCVLLSLVASFVLWLIQRGR